MRDIERGRSRRVGRHRYGWYHASGPASRSPESAKVLHLHVVVLSRYRSVRLVPAVASLRTRPGSARVLGLRDRGLSTCAAARLLGLRRSLLHPDGPAPGDVRRAEAHLARPGLGLRRPGPGFAHAEPGAQLLAPAVHHVLARTSSARRVPRPGVPGHQPRHPPAQRLAPVGAPAQLPCAWRMVHRARVRHPSRPDGGARRHHQPQGHPRRHLRAALDVALVPGGTDLPDPALESGARGVRPPGHGRPRQDHGRPAARLPARRVVVARGRVLPPRARAPGHDLSSWASCSGSGCCC